jgi:hypothetical protein
MWLTGDSNGAPGERQHRRLEQSCSNYLYASLATPPVAHCVKLYWVGTVELLASLLIETKPPRPSPRVHQTSRNTRCSALFQAFEGYVLQQQPPLVVFECVAVPDHVSLQSCATGIAGIAKEWAIAIVVVRSKASKQSHDG